MRIGIDVRLAFETGVGRYIRNLIVELSKLDTKNSYVLFVGDTHKKDIEQLVPKNWKIVATDIHWHSVNEQIQFPSLLNKEDLDVMHFPYFSLPVRYNKPFVVTIHDLIIHHFPTGKASTLPLPLYLAKRLAFKKVLQHGISKSQKIIVPLNAVRKDLLETFSVDEGKIVVTYEGFDNAIAESAVSSEIKEMRNTNYFLYVGNAYPHKNVEGLIRGFQTYKAQEKSDIILVLVGKKDYFYKRLEQKISEERFEDISIVHDVSDSELAFLYKHARAFISASFMEGFGLPPLEALAQGCLPLLSDIPSFKEVCQENALYFNPRDPQDIANILQKSLVLDTTIKERMIQRGIQHAKSFSWKKMASQTLAVYHQVGK